MQAGSSALFPGHDGITPSSIAPKSPLPPSPDTPTVLPGGSGHLDDDHQRPGQLVCEPLRWPSHPGHDPPTHEGCAEGAAIDDMELRVGLVVEQVVGNEGGASNDGVNHHHGCWIRLPRPPTDRSRRSQGEMGDGNGNDHPAIPRKMPPNTIAIPISMISTRKKILLQHNKVNPPTSPAVPTQPLHSAE